MKPAQHSPKQKVKTMASLPIRHTCDKCYEYESDCECKEFDGWTEEEISDRRMDAEREDDCV